MFSQKEKTKKELDELVRALAWNDDFGCFTRAGFEKLMWTDIAEQARWIVFFDVDGMHALNEAHGGYEFADAIMKDTLAILRGNDYVAGQWKSGDEFLICMAEGDGRTSLHPQGLVARLKQELNARGMSATFAIVPVTSLKLAENVQPAIDQVYADKKRRGVGR